MHKLKWKCCGWFGSGGGFSHAEFEKISPYCGTMISMSGEEMFSTYDTSGEEIIELPVFDRNEVDYFYVTVRLVIV